MKIFILSWLLFGALFMFLFLVLNAIIKKIVTDESIYKDKKNYVISFGLICMGMFIGYLSIFLFFYHLWQNGNLLSKSKKRKNNY